MRVLSGEIGVDDETVQGPLMQTGVPATVADWQSMPGSSVTLTTIAEHNAMIYVYKGSITISGKTIMQGEFAFLSHGEKVELMAHDTSGALIFAGQPIDEPVVHYGPFVMNSIEEIEQAVQDYNAGLFETY